MVPCGLGERDRIRPLPESVEWYNSIELDSCPQWDGGRRIHPLPEGARWYNPTVLGSRTHSCIHYSLTGAI